MLADLDLQASHASRAARHSQHQAPYQSVFCWNHSTIAAGGPPSRAGCYVQSLQIIREFTALA
jgi:hypothetical protein